MSVIPINANAAEPPALTVVVSNAPDDLSLSLRLSDYVASAQKISTAWESYYRFRSYKSQNEITLIVESSDGSYEIPLSESYLQGYNNILTLDYASRTVINGTSILRSVMLVGMRVGLTLLIEGLILFLFGYRNKASWIAFLIVNVITQSALNIALHLLWNGAYIMFALLFYEIIVFIFEAITFTCILLEHSGKRALFYTLTANTASLILGGILISYLPV